MKGKFRLGIIASLLLAFAGCVSSPPSPDVPRLLRKVSIPYQIFHQPWYQEFLEKYHRKPHLEIVRIDSASYRENMYGMGTNQKAMLAHLIEQIKESIASTRKVVIVSYSTRQFDSMERLFEMEHAASDSIAEPGHVAGADYVLVMRPGGTIPFRYKTPLFDVRFPLDLFLLMTPEIVFYPLEGPFYGWNSSISMTSELIDLRTDESIWSESYYQVEDTVKGTSAYITSTTDPQFGTIHLKLVDKKWVLAQ